MRIIMLTIRLCHGIINKIIGESYSKNTAHTIVYNSHIIISTAEYRGFLKDPLAMHGTLY